MLAKMDRGTFPVTVNEAKFPFRREVNGLLRERIRCNATIKLQLPTNGRDSRVAQPLTFAKEVCFNHTLVA